MPADPVPAGGGDAALRDDLRDDLRQYARPCPACETEGCDFCADEGWFTAEMVFDRYAPLLSAAALAGVPPVGDSDRLAPPAPVSTAPLAAILKRWDDGNALIMAEADLDYLLALLAPVADGTAAIVAEGEAFIDGRVRAVEPIEIEPKERDLAALTLHRRSPDPDRRKPDPVALKLATVVRRLAYAPLYRIKEGTE